MTRAEKLAEEFVKYHVESSPLEWSPANKAIANQAFLAGFKKRGELDAEIVELRRRTIEAIEHFPNDARAAASKQTCRDIDISIRAVDEEEA